MKTGTEIKESLIVKLLNNHLEKITIDKDMVGETFTYIPLSGAVIAVEHYTKDMKTTNAELLEALKAALPYVKGAYECAFPDQSENDYVIGKIESVISKAEAKPE